MTPDNYKQARTDLAVNVDKWCEELGISQWTHDSYSCGRREVPARVRNHIRRWCEHVRIVGHDG